MMNQMATDVMSDGTASNQINGLQALVSTTPTSGTVGGIDRSTNAFWRNVVRDITDDFTTYDGDGVRRGWNKAWLDVTRGADRPDLIVCDANQYELYENSLQTLQRYASENEAASGFVSLKYKDADVFYDSTVPADQAYMLNCDYLELLTYPGANFEATERKVPTNQDAFVQHILWMGNLTLSNSELQAVIKQ